jgi:hypothetical protein
VAGTPASAPTSGATTTGSPSAASATPEFSGYILGKTYFAGIGREDRHRWEQLRVSYFVDSVLVLVFVLVILNVFFNVLLDHIVQSEGSQLLHANSGTCFSGSDRFCRFFLLDQGLEQSLFSQLFYRRGGRLS